MTRSGDLHIFQSLENVLGVAEKNEIARLR